MDAVLLLAFGVAMQATQPPPARTLTLDAALHLAAARHPQIVQAHASTSASLARVDQQGAGLLPQVTATTSYLRKTANTAPAPGSTAVIGRSGGSSFDTYGTYNFGLNAQQLVYDFGQTSGGWHAAQASADAQRENETTTKLAVVTSVRTTFFLAWQQRALIAVAREALANDEKHVAQVQAFVSAGSRPEIDLAQVRADRASARLQLLTAENAYEIAKAQLDQAIGVPRQDDYDVADEQQPEVEGEDATEDRLVASASAARPELRSLARQADAQRLQLAATRGGYGPTIGVSTGVNEAGPELNAMAWNWNAQATMSWPLFQGGVTRAQVRESEATLISTEAQTEAQRQQIRLDIAQARLAVRAGKASIEAASEVELNARERHRLAEARYQAGAGSIIELQDAQVALTTASGQVIQARYNLAVARAQLLRALGRD